MPFHFAILVSTKPGLTSVIFTHKPSLKEIKDKPSKKFEIYVLLALYEGPSLRPLKDEMEETQTRCHDF